MSMGEWEKLFAPHILQRGYDYYKRGAVVSLEFLDDEISANVMGSELYSVKTRFEHDGIAVWHCTCPYAEDGTPCKHLAAVLYAAENVEWNPNPAGAVERIEEMINSLDADTLRSLLLRIAKTDRRAAELVRLASEPVSDETLEQCKVHVDRLLARAHREDKFFEYGAAHSDMLQLEAYILDTAGTMLDAGQIWEAFQFTVYSLCAASGNEVHDSDGTFSNLTDTCFKLWEEQIAEAPSALQREIYTWLRDSYTTASDFCRKYFLTAQLELFTDPEYTRESISQLDAMINAAQANGRDNWYIEDLVLKRLELMERLKLPSDEIRRFENCHNSLPAVRDRIIRRLFDEENYEEAEKLLLEGKTLYPKNLSPCAHYSRQLIALYEQTNQPDKLLGELIYQVFEFAQADLKYVEKLKNLVPISQWTSLRDRLLGENTLSDELREELLDMEEMYEKLLDLVIYQENFPALDRWEAVLAPRFPERYAGAYLRCIDKFMTFSTRRDDYIYAINRLKRLHTYPGNPDVELAEHWKATYPARRAMLDELGRAGY